MRVLKIARMFGICAQNDGINNYNINNQIHPLVQTENNKKIRILKVIEYLCRINVTQNWAVLQLSNYK